jgi:antitoxin component of MazEF toxin-antitoxin module
MIKKTLKIKKYKTTSHFVILPQGVLKKQDLKENDKLEIMKSNKKTLYLELVDKDD